MSGDDQRPTESVWDYPRPPRVEPTDRRLRVVAGGILVADTRRGLRVLETSHPPTCYLPPDDVRLDLLEPSAKTTVCEYKGRASYWHVRLPDGRLLRDAAWSYPSPSAATRASATASRSTRVGRRVPGRRRARPGAGGRLLRWLGDERDRRAHEGRPRDRRLVGPREGAVAEQTRPYVSGVGTPRMLYPAST